MVEQPRKRHGALIFSLIFLAIAGGIAATVLLANDRRNLRIVLREIGVESRTMVIPKPGVMEGFKGKSLKGNRLEGTGVMIPAQMFIAPVTGRDGAFLRTLEKKDGEGFCQLLRGEGFDTTPWAAGAFTPSLLECSYEATIPNAEKPEDPSTFFLMVKGTASGDLVSARAKIVVTNPAAQAELATRAATLLKVFAAHTRWPDLAADLSKVASLQSFAVSSHGISVKFQSEFSGPGRYNLILSAASPLTAPQQRTRDYFERKHYWPLLPEHGGEKPVPTPPVEG
jgi:hypothetical protein